MAWHYRIFQGWRPVCWEAVTAGRIVQAQPSTRSLEYFSKVSTALSERGELEEGKEEIHETPHGLPQATGWSQRRNPLSMWDTQGGLSYRRSRAYKQACPLVEHSTLQRTLDIS